MTNDRYDKRDKKHNLEGCSLILIKEIPLRLDESIENPLTSENMKEILQVV